MMASLTTETLKKAEQLRGDVPCRQRLLAIYFFKLHVKPTKLALPSGTVLVNAVSQDKNQDALKAIDVFSKRFADLNVKYLPDSDRAFAVVFCQSGSGRSCLPDILDGLAAVVPPPFSVWEIVPCLSSQAPAYCAKIVRLDFLDRIRRTITEVQGTVRERISEFEKTGEDRSLLFSEMSFCILTANFTAEGGARIQREIGDGFMLLSSEILSKRLRSLGYRFPTTRACYIVENRSLYDNLHQTLKKFRDGPEARAWLVDNVLGFGYKEGSHFLRNIGFKDVAIIDRHILKFLAGMGLIDIPKTLTKKRYLSIERLLRVIADRLGITLAELDLYLWYMMTGKILK